MAETKVYKQSIRSIYNIKDAYSEFEGWITSGGTQNEKWYNSFDYEKTFQNNKN